MIGSKNNFQRIQAHFRTRRFARVERLIHSVLATKDEVSILDAGGRAEYWNMLSPELRSQVRITCLNIPDELDLYAGADTDLHVTNIAGDACNMPEISDGSFDIVHSNSVIEHVGTYENMRRFASELRRVGRAYYVQTPNFWFPIEPHFRVPFIHWTSDAARLALYTRISIGNAKKTDLAGAIERIDRYRMIPGSVLNQFFPDGQLVKERVLGLVKSNTVVRQYKD